MYYCLKHLHCFYYLKIDSNLNILDEKIFGDPSYREQVMSAKLSIQNETLLIGTAGSGQFDTQLFFYRVSIYGDSLQ